MLARVGDKWTVLVVTVLGDGPKRLNELRRELGSISQQQMQTVKLRGLERDGLVVYLWRAVDAEGEVLDVLVQTRRNKRAALRLMRKLLKKYGFVPDKLVTDELRSYVAAASPLGIVKRHERGRWRNNRAENSHQPTRRRERKMQGFKSVGSAQRFLSTHAATYNTFNVQRHLTSARTHRAFRASAMQAWREVVAAA